MLNREQVLINATQDFVLGLTITACAEMFISVDVWESRTIEENEWIPIYHEHQMSGDTADIAFGRPSNAVRFKVVVHGELSGSEEVFFRLLRPRSIEQTIDFLGSKRICFTGCAKNCATNIERSIRRMALLGSMFKEYSIEIFENDSNDATVEKIRSLSAHFPIELTSRANLDVVVPERTNRLAYGRNLLRKRALNRGVDYVCVADMDGALDETIPTVESFLSNFSLNEIWDAVFPLNFGFYYDVWALRLRGIFEVDWLLQGRFIDAAFDRKFAINFAAGNFQTQLTELKSWLSVESAFGGMGIYKINALRNAGYCGVKEGRAVCEHVYLHEEMRKNGNRLFINPDFRVQTHH